MKTYRAALIGCSRMGAFIDNESSPGDLAHRLPYSHAACYETCDRTELVACSDLRVDVMEQVGQRYEVPKERQYTDYKEMITRERPDIVSVATQPEHRAEIVIHAAEHGAKAIYAEKALCATMDEAEAIVEAVERNDVVFNMGTNRRWHPGYDAMKQLIDSGELGALKTLIIYSNADMFNGSSHNFDLVMRLNGDGPASWVQAHLPYGYRHEYTDGSHFTGLKGDVLVSDPSGHGIIQFENGVTAYALLTDRPQEFEAICETGVVTSLSSDSVWKVRRHGEEDHRGRHRLVSGEFPDFEPKSPTLGLVEDLVHSLDTGEPPRGGVRLARANTELIFAFIESHRRGGARVELPLTDNKLRLQRDRAPRQPKYEPRR